MHIDPTGMIDKSTMDGDRNDGAWRNVDQSPGSRGENAVAAFVVGGLSLVALPALVATGNSIFGYGGTATVATTLAPKAPELIQGAQQLAQQTSEVVKQIANTGLLKVTEAEGALFQGEFQAAKGSAQIMAEASIKGKDLVLNGMEIQGKWTLKEAYGLAKELGAKLGMDRVVIEAAKRSTGANPWHVPKPLIIGLLNRIYG